MYRVLLVDDEQNILNALHRVFASESYQLESFTSPRAALARIKEIHFDLILSDYRMPEMNGVAFLDAARRIQPDAMRLVLSGYADLEAVVAAINVAEIYRFIGKPWQDYELKATVAQALAHRELAVENQRLANQVRAQQAMLQTQLTELQRLETEHPGITQVRWGADGSVEIGGHEP